MGERRTALKEAAFSLSTKERARFWLGGILTCAVAVGFSIAAFFAADAPKGWALYALGLSLSSFLVAYLLANFRDTARVERLVSERTAELKEANRRMQKLSELKDEFIANVSHELRTPMAIIREGVSQTLEGVCGKPTPQQTETLGVALRNIDRLGRLIEDLLDISRIEAGKAAVFKEVFDLREVIQETCAIFQPKARERGLRLAHRLPGGQVMVHADREKLAQIFINLVENAVKFTKSGSVEIAAEEREGEVRCSVSDTGPGITRGDLPKLFQKFQQFERVVRSGEKGTGLGLAICKGIVELHGGKIWAESESGKGSRFLFTIPRQGNVSHTAHLFRRAGFTLVELILAIVLLTGGISAAAFMMGRGVFATTDAEGMQQGAALAQEKMESIRGAAFGSIAGEAKAALSGWAGFSREVTVTTPQTDWKQVVVTVYWDTTGGELSTALTSYVANVSNN